MPLPQKKPDQDLLQEKDMEAGEEEEKVVGFSVS